MENAEDEKVGKPDKKNQDTDLEDDDYNLVDPPPAPISEEDDDESEPTQPEVAWPSSKETTNADSEQSDDNPDSKVWEEGLKQGE